MGVEIVPAAESFDAMRAQYDQYWGTHVASLEQARYRLLIFKQGIELLLLVGSFLIYYLLDCIAVVMAMPLPPVR